MKRIFLAAAMLLCFALLSFGQQMPQLPNDPEVKVGKLENGLTYYIRHNDNPAQRAEFYLTTHVGAIQEAPDQDGLAHFLEHMCFNGTKNFPGKNLISWLESIGAEFGRNINASTGVEYTSYMLNNIPLIRPTVVDSCILILHDYSHFVTCDPSEIDAERGVILEEKRTHADASWRALEKANKYYFGDTKYATTTVIGSEENLKTFKYESLTNFYHTWYTPNNQAIIIVGDINVDEVEAKIISTFADVPAPENPAKKDVIEIPDNEEPIVGIITDPEETNNVILLAWKSKPRPNAMNSTPYGLMYDLVEYIISIALNERLTDISAKPDSPFMNAFFLFDEACETMQIAAARIVFTNGNHSAALESLFTEIEKMRRYGFSDSEIERAKSSILSRYEAEANSAESRKNSEFIYPIIDHFIKNSAFMAPQTEFETIQGLLSQLTPEIINQFASALITKNNILAIYNGIEGNGAVIPTEQELKDVITKVQNSEISPNTDESIPTQFIDPSTLKGCKAGKISDYLYGSQTFTLKNGLKVVLMPTEYEKDKVSIELIKKGGRSIISDEDLPSFDENIWSAYCLNSGVADYNATTVSKILSGKQISTETFIGLTTHGITANTTRKDLETAFQLCYLKFNCPRFDENEYTTTVKQIDAFLANIENNPLYGFTKMTNQKAFKNPSRHELISKDVLSRTSLATMERIYKEQLFNDVAGATLFVVGDFDKDATIPLIQKYFGSLAKGKNASDWTDIDGCYKYESVYDEIRTKLEVPKVTVYQYYAIASNCSEANEAAISALYSILYMLYTQTLREEEGGTYGARIHYRLFHEPENQIMLQIYFDTNVDAADKLRALAVKGFKDIAEKGPDAEMFNKAVKNLKKNIPEQKLKNDYWVKALQDYEFYGYTIDKYEEAVNNLTPDQVKALAAEFINNGSLAEFWLRPE